MKSNSVFVPGVLGCSVLIILTACLFAPALTFHFINFDDPTYVTSNPAVLGGIQADTIYWAFSNAHGGHWHPLTWLSHALDVELFGVSAPAHHAVNIAIHCLNGALLFLVLSIPTRNIAASFFCALAFAIYPLRIESVAWISERKDVLHVFFGLLTILCFLQYRLTGSRLTYAAALASFTLGLLSKPMLVTLPFLLCVFDYWPLRLSNKREQPISLVTVYKQRFFPLIPFLILSIATGLLCLWAQTEGGGLRSMSEVPASARILATITNFGMYLGKLLWPQNLSVFYPFFIPSMSIAAGSFLLLSGITASAIVVRHKSPYILAGWLWFLIATLPISGVISVGGQSVADRWTYLPHVGLLFAVSFWWFDHIKTSLLRLSCPAALCLLLALSTHQQLPHWRDSFSLYTQALQRDPDNFLALNNLAAAYEEANSISKAIEYYQAAFRANPYYPRPLVNLARIRISQGRFKEGRSLLTRALDIHANHPAALMALARLDASTGNTIVALDTYAQLYARASLQPGLHAEIQHLLNAHRAVLCADLSSRSSAAIELLPTDINPASYCRPNVEQMASSL